MKVGDAALCYVERHLCRTASGGSMRNRFYAWAAIFLACAVGSSIATSAYAAVPPPQDDNWTWSTGNDDYPPACANVLFIGVRGSGENDSENFGPMVAAVRNGLYDAMPAGFTVRQIGVGYPARATAVLGEDIQNLQTTYLDGMLDGVQRVWRDMLDSVNRCPDQQIVLAGYSQGAGVIHRVLVDFPYSENVRAAVLIADPARLSGAKPGLLYGAPKRIGGLLPVAGLPFDPIAASYRPKIIEYCKTSDPVCDLGGVSESGLNPGGIAARLLNDQAIHGEYKIASLESTGRSIGYSLRGSAPSAPVITGLSYPRSTLTANTTGWDKGSQPLAYQWYRDLTPIQGATGRTYTTTWDDVVPGDDAIGSATRITVRVTAPGGPYTIKSAVSRAMYFSIPQVAVGGTPQVGKTLLAKIGTWSPAPYEYQYQWYRALPADPNNRQAIPGATSKAYTVTSDDSGAVLQVFTTLEIADADWPQWFESRSTTTAPVAP